MIAIQPQEKNNSKKKDILEIIKLVETQQKTLKHSNLKVVDEKDEKESSTTSPFVTPQSSFKLKQ